MAKVVDLFGAEPVSLDSFQQILLQMTTNASASSLSKFFSKNYRPLYQFILRMYLSSLTVAHPDRGRTPQSKNSSDYTVHEHAIIAEWANLLTDDEPVANNSVQSSPSLSNTANVANAYATVDASGKNKHKSAHGHSQSFAEIAQLQTSIAVMQNTPHLRTATHANAPITRRVNFDGADDSKKDDIVHYQRTRTRGSIWDGVLDVNNIIAVPETPKWRPRFSFQQNQLVQQGLLDRILFTIAPQTATKTKTNQLMLVEEVGVTSVDAICLYLPLLCVFSGRVDNMTTRDALQTAILERVPKQADVKQHFEFFLHSYKDASDLRRQFNHANNRLSANRAQAKNPTIASPHIGSTVPNDAISMDDFDIQASHDQPDINRRGSAAPQNTPSMASKTTSNSNTTHKHAKMQHIVQSTPESAISLFQSIFRHNLGAGSEIKLCRESKVCDPINCHAPPLSRIEIREVIATNSKPYLVDLYVANRIDDFECLSSTVILKKGDDLRRDAATLHVFRLMNKIWREKGLEFTQVPVNAFTYKCIPMSPDMGAIQLIEGCKPLRLVSALEDTITIAQQFNLVASAAGSYIASYVMGVRDRHFDNVLIKDNDCTLFHIDFGFLFGDSASVDTSKFAITSDLKKLMGVFWDKFIELGVQSFLALREKHEYLIRYATVVFEHLENKEVIEQFMRRQLHTDDMEDDQVAKYIARKLKESPDSVKTKFKNVVHKLATAKKINSL